MRDGSAPSFFLGQRLVRRRPSARGADFTPFEECTSRRASSTPMNEAGPTAGLPTVHAPRHSLRGARSGIRSVVARRRRWGFHRPAPRPHPARTSSFSPDRTAPSTTSRDSWRTHHHRLPVTLDTLWHRWHMSHLPQGAPDATRHNSGPSRHAHHDAVLFHRRAARRLAHGPPPTLDRELHPGTGIKNARHRREPAGRRAWPAAARRRPTGPPRR